MISILFFVKFKLIFSLNEENEEEEDIVQINTQYEIYFILWLNEDFFYKKTSKVCLTNTEIKSSYN